MEIAEIITIIVCFIFGAIFGSFACCQARRLRLRQTRSTNLSKWSICLSCGHRLKTSENIPVFSWLFQRGRCKHCGARIGKTEIISEIGLGLIFAAFGAFFYPAFKSILFRDGSASDYLVGLFNYSIPTPPLLISMVFMLAISIIAMWILLLYDAKWQELPTRVLTILNACAIIYTILRFAGIAFGCQDISDFTGPLLSTLSAVLILAGLYFSLYFFSKERLVGSGDWLVALPIALLLGNWWLALIVLFLSNFLGSIVGLTIKFKKGLRQIPFGPFLILSFIIVYIMQPWLLNFLKF